MRKKLPKLPGVSALTAGVCAGVCASLWASAAAAGTCGAETHRRYGETRAYFQDVLAACRPGGYCSVVGEVSDPTRQTAFRQQFRVARPAAGAPYQVQFAATDPMPAATAAPMRLDFAGTAFDLSDHVAATDAVNEYRVQGQAMADSIVGELKKARAVRWTYQGDAGPATATFPLNGLAAALAWIDCLGGETRPKQAAPPPSPRPGR